ncbi:MAG: DUF4407 domain-containing protein [Haliscomenobacteraceae bacterium CHB4]|nr:DUF4407 domain-containing protein [Haliscomenobacteraceae bacterium CHB4]
MKTPQDFFLFCSGVETSVLEKCPTDRNKYAGIGATVFFTGVLAFISSGYALFTVFDSYLLSIAFGLVWGLMIFNLDRYIVMSMKSNGNWWRDFFVAFPRLVMAVLLAVVISKPLELKIFEKEIRAEMVQMEQEVFKQQEDRVKERYNAQIADLRAQTAALKGEIAAKTAARDSLARIAVQEADGTGGSRQRNLGPIYRAKRAEADQAQAELNTLVAENQPLIREKEQAIQNIEAFVQSDIAALDRSRLDGLAARLDALSRLSGRSLAIFYASIFITLLFVAVETAPILVKLISYRSPYDYVLHQQEHVFEMANLEQVTLLSNNVKNKLKFDTETGTHRVNANIAAEKAVIDQKLKETLEGMKNKGFDWEGVG